MAKLIEMDERVGIFEQMEEDVGPVILINKFCVHHDEFDQFMKGWAAEAKKFKEQPGFISTQLHKGIGGSSTFVNYAIPNALNTRNVSTYYPCIRSALST